MKIKYTGEKDVHVVLGVLPYWREEKYVFDKANKHVLEVNPMDEEAIKFLLHPDRKGLFKAVDEDVKVTESAEIIVPKEEPKEAKEEPKEESKKRGRPKKK